MTTLADDGEVHPEAPVTVKEYVPAASPDIVVVVPEPVVVPPGVLVNVQLPAGKPFNTTLPVATVQVGWVIVPIAGAVGVAGCVLITTFVEAGEVHPEALVTVKLYVPAERPVIVVLVVDPVTDPGLMVQLPEGKPLNTTLPVPTVHVGWVIVPTTGAEGVEG